MTEENATPAAPSEEPNLLGAEEANIPQPEEASQFPEPSLEHPAEPKEDRPEWLPEKFKSAEALAESYKNLEKSYHAKREIPEKYELSYNEEAVPLDDKDQEFFKELGFTNKQAQGVYTALMETLVPQLRENHVEKEMAKLSGGWNMEAGSVQFKERVGKINTWANENLPAEVVKSLSVDAKGVKALFSMMQSQAGLGGQPAQSGAPQVTAAQLNDMVKDPRYLTDEGFQKQVEAEFKKYYDRN